MTEDYLRPAQRRALESQSRFAKGGAAKMSPASAWQNRPPHIKRRLARGSGAPKIHVEHPGGGLVMSIHLSDVGPHAISLGHSGGVNVARMAEHKLRSDAHMASNKPVSAEQRLISV